MTFSYNVFCSCTEDFEVLDGDLHGLPDTVSFLNSLAELDAAYDSVKNAEKRQMRERKAAAGIFNWEVSVIELAFLCLSFFSSFDTIRLSWEKFVVLTY